MADGISIHFDTARFTHRLRAFGAVVAQEADRAVFETTAQVLSDTVAGWPVDSGASRAAWSGPRKIGAYAYQISNPFIYANVLEYGGYPGPGAKTERFSGERLAGGLVVNPGVYSRQRPAAPLRRALAKNYGSLTREIATIQRQHWGR